MPARAASAVLLALALACSPHGEPPPPAKSQAAVAASPAPGPAATRKVQGSWFALELPAGWVDRPLRTDAERGVSEGMWKAPPDGPAANVVVMKPVPFSGDAESFAAQSLFAYAEMGLGVMVPDGALDLGGIEARSYRGTIAMQGKAGELIYWFFVRDGSGAAIQCGGEHGDAMALCRTIAASFRVTAPLPMANMTLPAVPVTSRALPGHVADVREDWQLYTAISYPDAVFQLRGPAPLAGMFPSSVLRRRLWPHAGAAWETGVEQELTAENTRILKREKVSFLGEETTMLEVLAIPGAGGFRGWLVGRVKDGVELRLSCVASPLVIFELRPDCLKLITSLWPDAEK